MQIPDEIVSAAVIGAGGLLLHNSWRLRSVSQSLKAHITSEEINDRKTRRTLMRIKKKLPNGEVEKTFEMVRELHEFYAEEIAEWKLQKIKEEKGAEVKNEEVAL